MDFGLIGLAGPIVLWTLCAKFVYLIEKYDFDTKSKPGPNSDSGAKVQLWTSKKGHFKSKSKLRLEFETARICV